LTTTEGKLLPTGKFADPAVATSCHSRRKSLKWQISAPMTMSSCLENTSPARSNSDSLKIREKRMSADNTAFTTEIAGRGRGVGERRVRTVVDPAETRIMNELASHSDKATDSSIDDAINDLEVIHDRLDRDANGACAADYHRMDDRRDELGDVIETLRAIETGGRR